MENKKEPSDISISTDQSTLNIDFLHHYLSNSYWSPGISREKISTGIKNSLCFGLYKSGAQIGFARVITDYTRFAYLLDVFIADEYKGNGYGKLLIQHIMQHENLQVDKWMLGTRDAHRLYEKYGFTALKEPNRIMEKKRIG